MTFLQGQYASKLTDTPPALTTIAARPEFGAWLYGKGTSPCGLTGGRVSHPLGTIWAPFTTTYTGVAPGGSPRAMQSYKATLPFWGTQPLTPAGMAGFGTAVQVGVGFGVPADEAALGLGRGVGGGVG